VFGERRALRRAHLKMNIGEHQTGTESGGVSPARPQRRSISIPATLHRAVADATRSTHEDEEGDDALERGDDDGFAVARAVASILAEIEDVPLTDVLHHLLAQVVAQKRSVVAAPDAERDDGQGTLPSAFPAPGKDSGHSPRSRRFCDFSKEGDHPVAGAPRNCAANSDVGMRRVATWAPGFTQGARRAASTPTRSPICRGQGTRAAMSEYRRAPGNATAAASVPLTSGAQLSSADALIDFVLAFGMETKNGIICATPVRLASPDATFLLVSMRLASAAARVLLVEARAEELVSTWETGRKEDTELSRFNLPQMGTSSLLDATPGLVEAYSCRLPTWTGTRSPSKRAIFDDARVFSFERLSRRLERVTGGLATVVDEGSKGLVPPTELCGRLAKLKTRWRSASGVFGRYYSPCATEKDCLARLRGVVGARKPPTGGLAEKLFTSPIPGICPHVGIGWSLLPVANAPCTEAEGNATVWSTAELCIDRALAVPAAIQRSLLRFDIDDEVPLPPVDIAQVAALAGAAYGDAHTLTAALSDEATFLKRLELAGPSSHEARILASTAGRLLIDTRGGAYRHCERLERARAVLSQ
jgi:hypothetical protein